MTSSKSDDVFAVLTAATCLVSALVAQPCEAASRHFYKGSVSASIATADRMMMKGKYADAATYYQTALKRNPHDTNANIGYGMALTKQFKLDAADDQFNKALAHDPNNPGALAGKALTMLNRLQSSSNTIRKAKDSVLKDAEAQAQKAIDADKRRDCFKCCVLTMFRRPFLLA